MPPNDPRDPARGTHGLQPERDGGFAASALIGNLSSQLILNLWEDYESSPTAANPSRLLNGVSVQVAVARACPPLTIRDFRRPRQTV